MSDSIPPFTRLPDVGAVLERYFGFPSLWPWQAEVVERACAGGDSLVVMPTGSGKSLCYQVPALLEGPPGITLVFSPLIALMEDQVAALRKRGIRAQYINSTLKRAERERRYAQVAAGEFDLVYATPERMHKSPFRAALETVPGGVRLLAVDECHCVTKWGHDLRPAYQEVGAFREDLGSPPTIALTATATRRVREDVRTTLRLDEASMPLVHAPIDRPNLSLASRSVYDDGEKIDAIRRLAGRLEGTGIVYFALIKDLERFLSPLKKALPKRSFGIYHGRLDGKEKKRVYERFITATPDEGLVLLATNAFGMGVDKADIRFIAHAQIPGSVEAYWQEVGRAGRDGDPSACELLYAEEDLAIQRDFIEWMNPPTDLVRRIVDTLRTRREADFNTEEIAPEVTGRKRPDGQLEYALIELEKLGAIERTPFEDRWRFLEAPDDAALAAPWRDEKRTGDLERLLHMVKLTRAEDIPEAVRSYFEL